MAEFKRERKETKMRFQFGKQGKTWWAASVEETEDGPEGRTHRSWQASSNNPEGTTQRSTGDRIRDAKDVTPKGESGPKSMNSKFRFPWKTTIAAVGLMAIWRMMASDPSTCDHKDPHEGLAQNIKIMESLPGDFGLKNTQSLQDYQRAIAPICAPDNRSALRAGDRKNCIVATQTVQNALGCEMALGQ